MTARVKVNIKEIPSLEMGMLVKALFNEAEQFYKDPENQAAFEKWQAERQCEEKKNGEN